jgi:outer membrane protein assembly factor BamB
MDKNRDGFWSHKEFTDNFSHGSGKPLLIAVRPGGKGNITDSHVEWELNRGIPEIPSPVLFKDRLYMVRSGGLLSAINSATGKPLYSERLGGSGQYSASPVIANGHLYLASETGQITIAKAGDTFEIVHQHKLGASIHVSPAFDASTLYIRSTKHLWAFRKQD